MLILLYFTIFLWAAGFLLLPKLRRCDLREVRTQTLELEGTPKKSDLSIIIPARNEAHNLPILLRSLATQSLRPAEIIVVDDLSTDDTAEVARKHGALVITSQPLPEGWRGKNWACHQGAQAAKASLLMFVDADTWFEPEGLERILDIFGLQNSSCPTVQKGCKSQPQTQSNSIIEGAFSAGPYHVVQKPYEELSLFFNFNMIAGTVPHGLFGQMLLVDRNSYWRVGGHQSVREKILENYFLSEKFRGAGLPTHSITGRGIFSFRMYPGGLRELIQGWLKGFAAGAGKTPPMVLILVSLWMSGLAMAPLGWAISGDYFRWGAVYLLCAIQVRCLSRFIGTFRWYSALLYPVPLMFFFVVFACSVLKSGKTVYWKGRNIRAN